MKNVMKRAWEIYRTLSGQHVAKLVMALRMAWKEVKSMSKTIVEQLKAFMVSKNVTDICEIESSICGKLIKRISYREYKNGGFKEIKGTYDATTKTIEVMVPVSVSVRGKNREITCELNEVPSIVESILDPITYSVSNFEMLMEV